ncbi:predicted protein [Botrytis cinerea T4]|uniref:Uncharacterized protein n=1 Tax=Botryotinia fuckeliana (strain T4) TaxID=999810 RepID=G2YCR4_BOTF4|nr:predicted protein [Botrytis cinerea T4]
MARHEQRFDLDSGPMNPRCTLIEGCLKLVGNKYFDTTPSLTKLDETFHLTTGICFNEIKTVSGEVNYAG